MLSRWLGRSAVDLRVILSNLQQHGSVRGFQTTLNGQLENELEVEVSAVAAFDRNPPSAGFVIRELRPRSVVRRNEQPVPVSPSVERLTALIGRVPLKELVRESTDMIERLCIEAALELTGDNRASAAEMLGLSRQSLYLKLHRHGLGDLGSEA
jgi:transcriptional regulator PpsR